MANDRNGRGTAVATRSGGNGGTAVAQAPRRDVKHLMEQRRDEFAAALAGRVDPDAFLRVAYATITKSPKLLEATPASLLMALMECASLGLTPNGVLGEAYIVPFNNKVKDERGDRWEVQAQFMPGYRGLIKLARQSGVIRNIVVRAVHLGDHFDVEYGLDETLIHRPDLSAIDDELTFVYAVAHFTDSTTQFEVMSKAGVDKIRGRSKSKDNGPWVTDYEAMALKTVIRRLCKRLPLSDFDLARALEADNTDFPQQLAPIVSAIAAAGAPRGQTRTEQVRGMITGPTQAAEDDDPGPEEEAPPAAAMPADETDAPRERRSRQAAAPAAQPDPAPAAGPSGDQPAEVTAFVELMYEIEPKGGPATPKQRERLRQMAKLLFAEPDDEQDYERMTFLANSEDLAPGQAGKLISAGKQMADALGIAIPADPQAEPVRAAGDEDLDLMGGS